MTDVANPKRTSPDQLLPYHKKISAEGKAQMICFISYTYMVLKEMNYILNDGYNKNGLPVLVCIDCDLKRLISFKTHLDYANCSGEVICFDFQKTAIQEFCNDNIEISTVDSERVRELFLSC